MAKKSRTSRRVTAGEIRETLSHTLDRVEDKAERIIVNRRGKDIAALVPVADLQLLQAIEDKIDFDDARAALTESRRRGTKSWREIKLQLGL